MARVLRGEIWWADLNPTRGHEQSGVRPVLIISRDVFNQSSKTVIGIAVTSQEPRVGYPLSLEITSVKLPRRSWVKIGQVRTLSIERLSNRIGRVSSEELDEVIEGFNAIVAEQ
jgi:mRNA interferase MazF